MFGSIILILSLFVIQCEGVWESVGNMSFNARIYDIVMNGTKDLYFGGFFTEPFNHLGRWDGNQYHSLLNGTNGEVWVLAINPNTNLLWIGGNQTKCGSIDVESLCIWDGNSFSSINATDGLVKTETMVDFVFFFFFFSFLSKPDFIIIF